MRDFLRTCYRLGACLLLTLPLGAQNPVISFVSGPDFGTVGQPNVYPQSGSVSMDGATGARTTTGPGVTLGPAGALGTVTFTGHPGDAWLWQLMYTNGSSLVVLKKDGTNNQYTADYKLTNRNGPNLYPLDSNFPTVDQGIFPPSGTVTKSLGGLVNLSYLQPEGIYSGSVYMSLKDTTSNVFAPQVLITFKIAVKAYPTLTKVNDLSFGAILATSVNGSVVVPASGTASSTGGVLFLSTYTGVTQARPARFDITGTASRVVAITLPSSTTLREPISGGTLTVNTFTRSPSGTVTISAAGGPTSVFVGATLQVGASPPAPGTYSGVFTVLCVYN